MANERRMREAFKAGTITDNPLLVGGTTVNSAAFAGLPVVDSSHFLPIVLDPLGAGNGPEIVWITAHSSAATSATVVRGREGTSAAQHANTTPWVCAPLPSDVTAMAASAERPSGGGLPYLNQELIDPVTGEYLVYQGSTLGWKPPWNLPWGAVIDPDEATTSSSASTGAPVDSGLSITWTAVAGRRYEVHAMGHYVSSVLGTTVGIDLRDSGGTSSHETDWIVAKANNAHAFHVCFEVEGLSAGSVTRKITVDRSDDPSGTANVTFFADNSKRKGRMWVVDIGPDNLPS